MQMGQLTQNIVPAATKAGNFMPEIGMAAYQVLLCPGPCFILAAVPVPEGGLVYDTHAKKARLYSFIA